MSTIVNSYMKEIKMVSTPVGELRLLVEVIDNGNLNSCLYNKVVDTREEAIALRKAVKETGLYEKAYFSKNKMFVGVNEKTNKLEYEEKYVVVINRHFN